MPYQVLSWNKTYENNKSRERDQCRYVCIPNKQDGLGLTTILSEPDGASIYGIWNLILGAVSRQSRPRNGWLTDNGKPHGCPWTVRGMALRWRLTEKLCTRALEVLSSPSVGWIADSSTVVKVPAKCPPGARQQPVHSPSSILEWKGRERKGREGKGMEKKVKGRVWEGGTAAGDILQPRPTARELSDAGANYKLLCNLKGKPEVPAEFERFGFDIIRIDRLCRSLGKPVGDFLEESRKKFRAKGFTNWFVPLLLQEARDASSRQDDAEHAQIKAIERSRDSALSD